MKDLLTKLSVCADKIDSIQRYVDNNLYPIGKKQMARIGFDFPKIFRMYKDPDRNGFLRIENNFHKVHKNLFGYQELSIYERFINEIDSHSDVQGIILHHLAPGRASKSFRPNSQEEDDRKQIDLISIYEIHMREYNISTFKSIWVQRYPLRPDNKEDLKYLNEKYTEYLADDLENCKDPGEFADCMTQFEQTRWENELIPKYVVRNYEAKWDEQRFMSGPKYSNSFRPSGNML
jgi:hypothetical protein